MFTIRSIKPTRLNNGCLSQAVNLGMSIFTPMFSRGYNFRGRYFTDCRIGIHGKREIVAMEVKGAVSQSFMPHCKMTLFIAFNCIFVEIFVG